MVDGSREAYRQGCNLRNGLNVMEDGVLSIGPIPERSNRGEAYNDTFSN
jgi:hypothetical protein